MPTQPRNFRTVSTAHVSGHLANEHRREAQREVDALFVRKRAAKSSDPRDDDEPTPEMVHRRIKRIAMVPAIVTVPCTVHSADIGEYCYRLGDSGGGVCADRIIARASQR